MRSLCIIFSIAAGYILKLLLEEHGDSALALVPLAMSPISGALFLGKLSSASWKTSPVTRSNLGIF